MSLTQKEIKRLSAMELAIRLTRLQFDTEFEPLKSVPLVVLEEIAGIKKELRKRLVKMLGRDPYPPAPTKAKSAMKKSAAEPKSEKGDSIKFRIIVTSSLGSKAAEFDVEADSKLEADILARERIRTLGLKGAKYKIS